MANGGGLTTPLKGGGMIINLNRTDVTAFATASGQLTDDHKGITAVVPDHAEDAIHMYAFLKWVETHVD